MLNAGYLKQQIREKIDTSSFAKYYLLNEYFKTFDFSVTSVFFYYKDGKFYAGPPWDYDLSMGNTNGELAGRCREANSSQGVYADKNLFVYLADKSWFKEIVKNEYEEHYDFFAHIHTDGVLRSRIEVSLLYLTEHPAYRIFELHLVHRDQLQ